MLSLHFFINFITSLKVPISFVIIIQRLLALIMMFVIVPSQFWWKILIDYILVHLCLVIHGKLMWMSWVSAFLNHRSNVWGEITLLKWSLAVPGMFLSASSADDPLWPHQLLMSTPARQNPSLVGDLLDSASANPLMLGPKRVRLVFHEGKYMRTEQDFSGLKYLPFLSFRISKS